MQASGPYGCDSDTLLTVAAGVAVNAAVAVAPARRTHAALVREPHSAQPHQPKAGRHSALVYNVYNVTRYVCCLLYAT